MLEISHDLLEQRESIAELLSLVFGERAHCFSKGLHAAFARFPHQAYAFGRSFEAHTAAVFRGVPEDQAGALEAGDNAAHCWRTDLFGIGKLAERFWSAEDQDGEGGKLGGANAGFAIADAKAAQQVDGGGVKLIGDSGCGHVSQGANRCSGNLRRIGALARGAGGDCGGDRRSC